MLLQHDWMMSLRNYSPQSQVHHQSRDMILCKIDFSPMHRSAVLRFCSYGLLCGAIDAAMTQAARTRTLLHIPEPVLVIRDDGEELREQGKPSGMRNGPPW